MYLRGKYRFLSNFYIEPSGAHVEGKYQAHKLNPPVAGLLQSVSPGVAKRIGREFDLTGQTRKDWHKVNLEIMYKLVKAKFTDPMLAELLLATGDAELIESNAWDDRFWGQVNEIGENHLGKILMRVRKELGEADGH